MRGNGENTLVTMCPKCWWKIYIKVSGKEPEMLSQTTLHLKHDCMEGNETHKTNLVYHGESEKMTLLSQYNTTPHKPIRIVDLQSNQDLQQTLSDLPLL
jgi:hypothetical protein